MLSQRRIIQGDDECSDDAGVSDACEKELERHAIETAHSTGEWIICDTKTNIRDELTRWQSAKERKHDE